MRAIHYLIISLIYIIFLIILRKKKLWLFYFMVGAFGFALISIFFSLDMGFELFLERVGLSHVITGSRLFGIQTQLFKENAMLVQDPTGWSILAIGMECSALLESSVIAGLLLFYPAFSSTRRIFSLIFGLSLTYLSNILRLLIIVGITHYIGKSAVIFAHAVVGRLFFFACVLVIYWYLMTKPTISFIGKMVRKVGALKEVYRKEIPEKMILKWRNFVENLEILTVKIREMEDEIYDEKSYEEVFKVYEKMFYEFLSHLDFYKRFATEFSQGISRKEKKKALKNLEYCAIFFNSLMDCKGKF
ncbi:MAG: exosortase family protein XrtG [Candidatus Methanofastidiosia archaeon]